MFDWATRIDREVFKNRPAVYLATSPGPGGATSVLAAASGSAGYFGGNVKATVSVPSFYDNFDLESGVVTNESIAAQLKEAVAKLAA